MKKVLFLVTLIISFISINLSAQDSHDMDNMRVSIPATEFKSSRFIETGTNKSKDYIQGKSSSYNKKGESANKNLLALYEEYAISSKMSGGTYEITVYYTLDKNNTPDEPLVMVGMDLQGNEEIAIKNKLINTVKADFKVKALRGKNHTLKVWLPSQGVQINKFEIRRKIFSSKS